MNAAFWKFRVNLLFSRKAHHGIGSELPAGRGTLEHEFRSFHEHEQSIVSGEQRKWTRLIHGRRGKAPEKLTEPCTWRFNGHLGGDTPPIFPGNGFLRLCFDECGEHRQMLVLSEKKKKAPSLGPFESSLIRREERVHFTIAAYGGLSVDILHLLGAG